MPNPAGKLARRSSSPSTRSAESTKGKSVIGAFEFVHSGRTFTCVAEKRQTAPAGTWWWFGVSYDQQRYAPFEASASDTQQSVKSRIIEYYEHRLWVRAQPVVPKQHFARAGKPAPAPPPKT